MNVILLEKIGKLGDIGQTVKVKAGYARNFLFPKKIAIRATKENIEVFEKQKENLKKANLEKIKDAELLLKKIPVSVNIYREASEQGALFGSVTSRDIVNEINANSDITLKPKDIIIKKIIKNIGEYTADFMPHPEVVKEIKIIVQTIQK